MLRCKDDANRAAPVNVTVEERDRPNIECDRAFAKLRELEIDPNQR
jgi:hypothetical protein